MTNYVAKVLTINGSIIADPLPASNITFNEVLSFPANRRLASFSVDLIPPRGANSHYIHVYKQLDYMQRVELYEEETTGTPVFSGYIIDQATDLNAWSIGGQEWLGKLGQRRTGHYQPYPFTGLVTDMLLWILDTWRYLFFDDFTGTLSSWTQVSGTWSISSEQMITTGGGPTWQITTPLSLSSSQDDEFKVRIEFESEPKADTWTQIFTIFQSGTFPWLLTISHTATEDKTNFLLTQSGASDFTRDAGEYESPYEVISSVEFYIYDTAGGNQTCEVWLNGRQFMLSDSTNRGLGGNFLIQTDQSGAIFDNAIIFYRNPFIQQGIIDTSPTQTLGVGIYEPPQDTYLDVMQFLVNLLNFEWRTTAGIGIGGDSLDAAVEVGSDLSGIVRFEEGVNLTNLNLTPSGNKITTWFRFAGQGNDVNMALAEIYDKSAIDTFGIIENQLSNQRVSTVNLARQVASNELVKVKDGDAALTANVYVNPTMPEFRVGDTVWVKSTVPDFDQSVKVIQIDHVSGSDVKAITFESFARSRTGKIGQLDNDVGIINRGKSLNAAQVILQFKPGSRFIDCNDSRFIYIDSGSGSVIPPTAWIYMTKGLDPLLDPFPGFAPWNGTMNFESEANATVSVSLATTACRLVYHGNTNVRECQVIIDGANANVHDMWTSSPTNAQNFTVDFTSVDPGLHIFTFTKEASIASQSGKFISIEGMILDSQLWHDIFLEGRAINEAFLSFTLSDSVSTNAPSIEIHINGIDRTVALGGPFTTNQTRLNVSQYISAPGLHQIDFKFNDPLSGTRNIIDQIIEAVLDVRLFV